MLHPEALHIFLRTTLPATLALCPIKTGKERTKPFESFWFPSQDSSPKSANMTRFAQLVSVLPARASSHEAGPKCRHGQPLTVNQWAAFNGQRLPRSDNRNARLWGSVPAKDGLFSNRCLCQGNAACCCEGGCGRMFGTPCVRGRRMWRSAAPWSMWFDELKIIMNCVLVSF